MTAKLVLSALLLLLLAAVAPGSCTTCTFTRQLFSSPPLCCWSSDELLVHLGPRYCLSLWMLLQNYLRSCERGPGRRHHRPHSPHLRHRSNVHSTLIHNEVRKPISFQRSPISIPHRVVPLYRTGPAGVVLQGGPFGWSVWNGTLTLDGSFRFNNAARTELQTRLTVPFCSD